MVGLQVCHQAWLCIQAFETASHYVPQVGPELTIWHLWPKNCQNGHRVRLSGSHRGIGNNTTVYVVFLEPRTQEAQGAGGDPQVSAGWYHILFSVFPGPVWCPMALYLSLVGSKTSKEV